MRVLHGHGDFEQCRHDSCVGFAAQAPQIARRERHGQNRGALVAHGLADLDNAPMPQPLRNLILVPQRFPGVRRPRHLGVENLQRDLDRTMGLVERAPDLALATRADAFLERVPPADLDALFEIQHGGPDCTTDCDRDVRPVAAGARALRDPRAASAAEGLRVSARAVPPERWLAVWPQPRRSPHDRAAQACDAIRDTAPRRCR